MKILFIILMLFSTTSLLAQESFHYSFTIWSKALNPTNPQSQIPQKLFEDQIVLNLSLPANHGEFTVDTHQFSFPPYSGHIQMYWMNPYPQSGHPPYFNVEIQFKTPAFIYCSQTPRSDWGTLPPLACGGEFENQLIGLTLIHQD